MQIHNTRFGFRYSSPRILTHNRVARADTSRFEDDDDDDEPIQVNYWYKLCTLFV